MSKKVLYLVRHGQRQAEGATSMSEGGLTPLGREQARLAGARMASFPLAAIHASTLRRATETAQAIAAHFPHLHVRRWNALCECLPGYPSTDRDFLAGIPDHEFTEGLAQAEAVFTRFFRPANRGEQHIALVCHGNLIRYLTCRVIGAPGSAWANLDINNGSLSRVLIEDHRMILVSFNDVGHLSPEMQTFI